MRVCLTARIVCWTSSERLGELTVDEGFENASPILLDKVIDVTKDSTAFEKSVGHISESMRIA